MTSNKKKIKKATFFKHKTALVSPKAKVGEGTRLWAFTNIQDGAVIGRRCNVCDCCYVEKGAVIGDHVTIKNGVSIFEGITIEDDVFIGTNTTFINDRRPRSHKKEQWVLEKTTIKKGASVGSNSTILCGLIIGGYAFIGAGSVVTKDVGPYVIVKGNPAREAGYACRCGRKLGETLECSCGLQYTRSQQGLRLNE